MAIMKAFAQIGGRTMGWWRMKLKEWLLFLTINIVIIILLIFNEHLLIIYWFIPGLVYLAYLLKKEK
jgi:hypothetical protein